uniref:Ubiquinol-cytochrome c reductase complex assembly factor 1 n=1 Tax=Hucho hucho TaxID=62062 RepID=A0A4W5MB22_9TELE
RRHFRICYGKERLYTKPSPGLSLFNVKETPQAATEEEVGAFTKLIEAMGFTGPLKYNKWRLSVPVRYSVNSLCFLLCRMCLVRMRQQGREGKYMCRYIVHSMWEDVEQRSKIMEVCPLNSNLMAMTETFYAAIFGYDEGILSDDGVLAAALWRNMFNRQCEDPRQLELMLEYVCKQMQFVDTLDGEDLLLTGEVKWRPLLEENAQSILKVPSPIYNDAGL